MASDTSVHGGRARFWQFSLRGFLLAVTALCILGYQQYQIFELKRELSTQQQEIDQAKRREQLAGQRALQSLNQARQVTIDALQYQNQWERFHPLNLQPSEPASNVGVPESVDKGMLIDAIE